MSAEFDLSAVSFGFALDTGADLVPEGSGAFEGVDGDAEIAAAGKIACGEIGAIVHGLRHL